MNETTFHQDLKSYIDRFVHDAYRVSRSFPKEEVYSATSQFRRAAMSVALNYVEGYARGRDKVHKNFLEISYGSLKESRYLIEFSRVEKWIPEEDAIKLQEVADKIGAMLWSTIRQME
ncbi:MAG: four helix bundle protein [Candidatus Uhrbacteria bacterium]